MKKIKIYGFLSFLLGLILILASVLIPIIIFNNSTEPDGCIDIMGGGYMYIIDDADIPTTIYSIIEYILNSWLVYILLLGLILFIGGALSLVFSKSILNNCSFKTTVISLAASLFCSAGLFCFLIWLGIVELDAMSWRPISYTSSIVGGLICLLAFITLIVFYIKARKENLKIKGIIFDIATSIIALPIFLTLWCEIYEILQSLILNK